MSDSQEALGLCKYEWVVCVSQCVGFCLRHASWLWLTYEHSRTLRRVWCLFTVSAVELSLLLSLRDLNMCSRHEWLLRSGVLLRRRTPKDEPELYLQTKDHRDASQSATAQSTLTTSLIQSHTMMFSSTAADDETAFHTAVENNCATECFPPISDRLH